MNSDGKCKFCGSHIVWAEDSETGRKTPLERSERGSIVIAGVTAYDLGAAMAKKKRQAGATTYAPHTCSGSKAYRTQLREQYRKEEARAAIDESIPGKAHQYDLIRGKK